MAKIDIGKLRKALGDGEKPLSQAELAKRLGVDQSTISRWETGEEPKGPAAILLQQLDEETDHGSGSSTERREGAAA